MSEQIKVSKKVVLLGDPGVGKTSMIRKFVYDIFEDKYISTLGMKVTNKIVTLQGSNGVPVVQLNMMIWDLMGQKDFKIFHETTFKGSHGGIIVCDLTRKDTLENIPSWITELFNVTGNIPIILIGNKNDLKDEKKIKFKELEDLASVCKASAFLTSAKTGENVESVFHKLGKEIIEFEK